MSAADVVKRALLDAGGCAYPIDLAAKIPWQVLVEGLQELETSGIAKRVGRPLDPTKPFATTKWCLAEGPRVEEPFGVVVALVANPPVVDAVGEVPPGVIGLMDSLSTVVCSSERSLRIMMPYLGELLPVAFMQCAARLRTLGLLRVLAEDIDSNRRALERLRRFMPNLEVKYATKIDGKVKVRGVHAKVIISDEAQALVGTFNLTQTHLLVNYDVGLLVRGRIVAVLAEVFDKLWEVEGNER